MYVELGVVPYYWLALRTRLASSVGLSTRPFCSFGQDVL